MTAGRPPTFKTLYMYCTGGTEVPQSHTQQSDGWCYTCSHMGLVEVSQTQCLCLYMFQQPLFAMGYSQIVCIIDISPILYEYIRAGNEMLHFMLIIIHFKNYIPAQDKLCTCGALKEVEKNLGMESLGLRLASNSTQTLGNDPVSHLSQQHSINW